jgi:hypothetical protein
MRYEFANQPLKKKGTKNKSSPSSCKKGTGNYSRFLELVIVSVPLQLQVQGQATEA